MPKTIVVVHGVGPTDPPEIAAAVAQRIGEDTTRESTVHVEGESFVEVTHEASGDSVLVVDWSELSQTKATTAGVLRQILYLVTCMVDVAARNHKTDMLFVPLYRWALFVMSPGAGLFLFSVAMGMTVPITWERRWLLGIFFVASAVLTYLLRPLGRHFLWLWLWTAMISAVWLAACRAQPHLHWFLWLSNKARLACFSGVIVLGTLAIVESLLRRRRLHADAQLAYCALIYIPFIAMNSLTVWLTLLGLGWLSNTWPTNYACWEMALHKLGGNFDLACIERAATWVFAALGLLAIALPLLGYRFKWGADDKDSSATRKRRAKGSPPKLGGATRSRQGWYTAGAQALLPVAAQPGVAVSRPRRPSRQASLVEVFTRRFPTTVNARVGLHAPRTRSRDITPPFRGRGLTSAVRRGEFTSPFRRGEFTSSRRRRTATPRNPTPHGLIARIGDSST